MALKLNPYLNFRAQAREAMTFYQEVFGGSLTMSTFGESRPSEDPAEIDLIMHAQLDTDRGLTLMASDTPASVDLPSSPGRLSISLSGDDDAVLREYFAALQVGGSVTLPLETAAWGVAFGMVTDKYGIAWMVNIATAAAPPIPAPAQDPQQDQPEE